MRLSYFTEPEMYVGGHGKSRKQQFEKNGSKGTNYLCHPHFMTILWYFISGPDLPKSTIDEFCKIIDEDMGTSGMVLTQIMAFVRREVREKQLKSNAAEEFFKLAHEICKPDLAVHVRSAAVSARR